MKLFSKISAGLILAIFFCLLPIITQAQFSDLSNNFNNNLTAAANKASYPLYQANENYINTRLGLFITLTFIGTIFLIMIVYSGIQWMTSGGNEQKVAQAKNRLTAAAIGLVIIMVAYIATYYINLYVFEAVYPPGGSFGQG